MTLIAQNSADSPQQQHKEACCIVDIALLLTQSPSQIVTAHQVNLRQ